MNNQISEIESKLLNEKELFIKTKTKKFELKKESSVAKEKFSRIENEIKQLDENIIRLLGKVKVSDDKLKLLKENHEKSIAQNKKLVIEQGKLNKK